MKTPYDYLFTDEPERPGQMDWPSKEEEFWFELFGVFKQSFDNPNEGFKELVKVLNRYGLQYRVRDDAG